MRVIDYDRGVIIKTVANIGMDVFMYKDTPGVYLTAQGKEVPEVLAAQAGYDVEHHRKMKERAERLAMAAEAVDKELSLREAKDAKRVVKEFGDYQVVALGRSGRFIVQDTDGNVLTPGQVLSEEVATSVAMTLAGVKQETPPQVKKPAAPPVKERT